MSPARFLMVAGLAALALGTILSLVPRYLVRASAEPAFAGTLWTVGLPVALVGVGMIAVAHFVESRQGRSPRG